MELSIGCDELAQTRPDLMWESVQPLPEPNSISSWATNS